MKSTLEKAKQALEKETSDLTIEVRTLATAKQDVEHKRKKVEGQLTDLQVRFTDSEKQKGELGERCSKITVRTVHSYTYTVHIYILDILLIVGLNHKCHEYRPVKPFETVPEQIQFNLI